MARYVSLTSVELESVMQVDANSSRMLVERGFTANSIVGFSSDSRVQSADEAVAILDHTRAAFDALMFKPHEFTQAMIKNIHATAMHGQDYNENTLNPHGQYRHV